VLKSRQEIKAYAKDAMKEQQGAAIFLILVIMAVGIAVSIVNAIFGLIGLAALTGLVSLAASVVTMVLEVNLSHEFVKIYNRVEGSVNSLFENLKVNFLRKLGGMWWMLLFVVLWSMLLWIPGIIKGISYSMTPYILANHPNVEAREALKLSMRMAHGHKMDIFIFMLSFLGWLLLSALTFGILFVVFVGPYFYTASAGLFVELRDKAIREGVIAAEELGMDLSTGATQTPTGNFN